VNTIEITDIAAFAARAEASPPGRWPDHPRGWPPEYAPSAVDHFHARQILRSRRPQADNIGAKHTFKLLTVLTLFSSEVFQS
jgi:hypothetical protein